MNPTIINIKAVHCTATSQFASTDPLHSSCAHRAGSIVNPRCWVQNPCKNHKCEMSNEIWEMAGRGKALRGMHAIGNVWIFPSDSEGARVRWPPRLENHCRAGAGQSPVIPCGLYLLMVAAAVENEMQHPQGTAGRDTRRARATSPQQTDTRARTHDTHTHRAGGSVRWH